MIIYSSVLTLWLRPTHEPHGDRNHVCMDMNFPIRAAAPEEPFNKPLEGREGGKAGKTSGAGVDQAESEAETRTHKETIKGTERQAGGGQCQGDKASQGWGSWRLREGEIRASTAAAGVPAACQVLADQEMPIISSNTMSSALMGRQGLMEAGQFSQGHAPSTAAQTPPVAAWTPKLHF